MSWRDEPFVERKRVQKPGEMNDINQPLCLDLTQPRALFQREITEAQAGAAAHQPQAFELIGLANGDLHRVATAGTQPVIKKLGSDPVLDGLKQRMTQVVLLMAFQAYQVGLKEGQPEGTTADDRAIGMRQTATVGCQPVRQPVVRLM